MSRNSARLGQTVVGRGGDGANFKEVDGRGVMRGRKKNIMTTGVNGMNNLSHVRTFLPGIHVWGERRITISDFFGTGVVITLTNRSDEGSW